MKPGITVGAGLIEPYRLGCATLLVCLLVPLLFLSAARTNQPLSIVNLQVWISSKAAADEGEFPVERGSISKSSSSAASTETAVQPGENPSRGNTTIPVQVKQEDISGASNMSSLVRENLPPGPNLTTLKAPPEAAQEKPVPVLVCPNSTVGLIPTTEESDSGTTPSQMQLLSPANISTSPGNSSRDGSSAPEQPCSFAPTAIDVVQDDGTKEEDQSNVECNFSEIRTDICELRGDVRIHGPSSTIKLIANPPRGQYPADQKSSTSSTWKVRPYARKWEAATMSSIKELTLSMSPSAATKGNNSRCGLNHSAPAVVFSTGGFQGNFFHELVDVLIPLFLTSHRYGGEVQFLIVDFKPWWVEKYRAIIKRLSRYEVISLDADDRVHCFRDVVVGLNSHKELGIDPEKAPRRSSMIDFRSFLRRCFQLKRVFVLTPPKQEEDVAAVSGSRKSPRLLIVSRKKSRVLTNEREVAQMARSLGYQVIMAGPEMTRNLTQMARIVNSCDVMMGVHGAGLSNMVFLPTNATIIQIIPWGGLKDACEFAFGDPAVAMGLRYLEYEIGKNESSLIKQYPVNHPVLTDPLSIHQQGFSAIWTTYLHKQDVTLDLDRFQGVLQQALESSKS